MQKYAYFVHEIVVPVHVMCACMYVWHSCVHAHMGVQYVLCNVQYTCATIMEAGTFPVVSRVFQ